MTREIIEFVFVPFLVGFAVYAARVEQRLKKDMDEAKAVLAELEKKR